MKRHSIEISGQLAFVDGEQANSIMPSAWLMSLHDPEEANKVLARFPAFRERVRQIDRDHLLGLTGLYALTGSIGVFQREASYPQVAELEFLQALALTGEELDTQKLQPDEVMPFWKELSAQYYVASRGASEARAPLSGIARTHMAFYRNPYGDEFFDLMVLSITKEYDDRYIRDGSFSRKGRALVVLRKEIWQRYVTYNEACQLALHGEYTEVVALLRRFNSWASDEAFNEYIGAIEIANLRHAAFNSVEDAAVKNLFALDANWIAAQEANGVPMASVLDTLSLLQAGEMEATNIASANPVWDAPAIKVNEGYVLYSPITLTSFPFRCLLTLLENTEHKKLRLEKIRGWFVEQEGRRIMEREFPSAQVVLSGFWDRTPGERVESDLLVLMYDRLFILEAKGALIPDRVRFGARDATIQFLKRIWGTATQQGVALANFLESANKPVVIRDHKGVAVMTLDPNKLKSVSRLGISVEQVGPLMNAPDILKEAGVLPHTTLAAPCIMLAELSQVFKNAANDLRKLHYLLRRTEVATKYQIIGDELDIYTTYLQFGFSSLPEPDKLFMVLGASYTLDDYRDENGVVRLPADSALKCSPYFLRVLQRAKERQSPVYPEVGLMLLDMPYQEQLDVERKMGQLFGKRPKTGKEKVLMMAVDAPAERAALAIVLIDKTVSPEERRTMGINITTATAEKFGASQVVCIVRVWKDKNSYDAIYSFGKSLIGRREQADQSI